jgi:hypothetical protein
MVGPDLKNRQLIIFKAVLFLVAGIVAAGLLVAANPKLETVFLLGFSC